MGRKCLWERLPAAIRAGDDQPGRLTYNGLVKLWERLPAAIRVGDDQPGRLTYNGLVKLWERLPAAIIGARGPSHKYVETGFFEYYQGRKIDE